MKYLFHFLMPFGKISLLLRIRGVFTKHIDGRLRNPAFPEKGRFTKKEAQTFCNAVLEESKRLQRTMPQAESSGGRYMTRGAVGTIAIYRGLRNAGIDHAYAIELGGDIGWEFYKISSAPVKWIGRLLARSPSKQMDIIQKMVVEYILQSPDYDVVVRNPPSWSAYDIRHCPMYEYAKTFGAEEMEFFQKTNCTWDWPWGESLVEGGYYTRTKSLCHGDELCDQTFGASA